MGWLANIGAKLKQWFPPEGDTPPLPPKPAPVSNPPKPKPVARHYPVSLPYALDAWKVGYLINMLLESGLWQKLPYDVAVKINAAYKTNSRLVITKADLDSLPEPVWISIAAHLTGAG